MSDFIPFHRPSIDHNEIDEVVDTLRSGWITTGPKTAKFEAEFRSFVGAPYALAVNSGTAALHLAVAALDLRPGDEVITSPLTFCATVNVILHTGATPVLADIDADGNIDPDAIRPLVSTRTRAVMPVHFAGLPCAMNEIWSLAAERDLQVIEDAAHAAGSKYKGTRIGGTDESGRRSAAACFSFYATKNMTTGEGGMVTTHDERLYEKMRVLCLHGINRDAWNRYAEKGQWFYQVVDCGFKYNLSDIQSAIGIHQLRKLEQFIERRRALARLYNELLADVEEVETPADQEGHAWHLYVLRLNLKKLDINRSEFMQGLRARNIGANVHFIPIPDHPYYATLPTLKNATGPRTVEFCSRLVSLPLYPDMTEEMVERVAGAVRDIAAHHARPLVAAGAQA
jgi:dTDP-4-amino-4,6-dideoxygalactose transaminase